MIPYLYFMMIILGIAFLVVLHMIFDEMRRDPTADEKVQAVFEMPELLSNLDTSKRNDAKPA